MKYTRFAVALLVFATITCSAQNGATKQLARAIARQEGFFTPGTIPNRNCNPGDLKVREGQHYLGQTGTDRFRHAIFPHRNGCAAGWAALYQQIDKIADRTSKIYTPEMTIQQVGRKYAASWQIWSKNVARNLNVSPRTTLATLLDVPPLVNPHPAKMILAAYAVAMPTLEEQ